MDYSSRYIMMVRNAIKLHKDIKEVLPVPFGAIYITENNKINLNKANNFDIFVTGNVWIPRIDELLDAVKWTGADAISRINDVFKDEIQHPNIKTYNTLEKILLSVVMMKRYSEEWDEESMAWVTARLYGIGTDHNTDGKHYAMAAGVTRQISEMISYDVTDDMLKDGAIWYIINVTTLKRLYKWDIPSNSWKQII